MALLKKPHTADDRQQGHSVTLTEVPPGPTDLEVHVGFTWGSLDFVAVFLWIQVT